jgi:tetratricopeptide (TPR) repeat protein
MQGKPTTPEIPLTDYDRRSAELWASIDEYDKETFLARIEDLVGKLPEDSSIAAFERACALDSTGHSDRAVPLYRRALELGLDGERRRRAVIQLASSLRNVGEIDESLRLLLVEREQPPDNLDDCVSAFLALALADSGREREAVSVAVAALAPHLPRYQRSAANYARLLTET